MGKSARKAHRSLAAVEDAVALARLARRMADLSHLKPTRDSPPGMWMDWEAGGKAQCMLEEWDKDRLVLRSDPDFASALLDTRQDIAVPRTCFERFPFSTAMVSFRPFDLDDGQDVCRYYGVLAVGATTTANIPPGATVAPRHALGDMSPAWTTYGPIADEELIRFAWFFIFPDTGKPGMQTITLPWRGAMAQREHTVAELIEGIREMYQKYLSLPGKDLDVLVPLSVALVLYLGSSEPDIDRPIMIGNDGGGGSAIAGMRVSNMGFRVGSALRDWKAASRSRKKGEGAPGNHHLPPHIRSAHWHRFRVATRDEGGNIVGDRLGEQDIDWHYMLKWLSPIEVNVGEDGPDLVVRDLG